MPDRTSERIRVSGFRPPFERLERHHRVRPVGALRPINLIGPIGAAGLAAAVALWGTPHMLLTYRSSGSGAYRWYEDCAYAALDGRMAHRRGAACPFFALIKEGR